MASESNEKELLAAAKAHDGDAFGKLLAPYLPGLKRHIGRRVYQPENADDVLQQTLLKAWQGLRGFEGRSQLSTWLYRIAENAANSHLQKRMTRTCREISISDLSPDGCFDWEGLAQTGHLETPDGRLEEKQRLDSLLADARLPPEMAETYHLRYWEQMSSRRLQRSSACQLGQFGRESIECALRWQLHHRK